LDQTHQYNGIKLMLVFSRGNDVTTCYWYHIFIVLNSALRSNILDCK
jgi:hypothetical protein